MIVRSRFVRAFPVLAACFLLAGCGTGRAEEPVEAVAVRTIVVGAAGEERRRYTGTVRSPVESELGFRVPGKIVERLVDPGMSVRRGQPLMRIDPTDLGNAAAAAAASLEAARAQAERAAADEERLRPLAERGFVSRANYEAAIAARRATAAQVAAARAAAADASNQRSYATLVADSDGIVMGVLAEPGQVVPAGFGVVRLARSGAREVAVSIPETQLGSLPQEGEASVYGTGTRLRARLRQIAGSADPATRTYEARYTLIGSAPPLGSTVTLELSRGSSGVLELPLAAIHDPGTGPGVWLVQGGRVTFRPLTLLALEEEAARVRAGALGPGARVVALGAHRLSEGQPVREAAVPGSRS